jgi:DNA excision repair protein ERCC-4
MNMTFPLPADLDFKLTIIVDSREQVPLTFSRLAFVRGGLVSGDYSIVGAEDDFAIERKSIADLVACCMGSDRERFSRELARLRGYRFARLLIVGSEAEVMAGRYRSNIRPQSILATVAAFEARYVPVVWLDTPAEAASRVEAWAAWYAREVGRSAARLVKSGQDFPGSAETQTPSPLSTT